jgi:hypothetical protein
MVSGSARKVLLTKPPKVAAAHTATKSTKKLMPSTMRVRRDRVNGFTSAPAGNRHKPASLRGSERMPAGGSLDEARVGQLGQVGDLP